MDLVTIVLCILFMGVMDRLRGDTMDFPGIDVKHGGSVDRMVYGWIIAVLVGHPFDMATLPIMLAMFIGMGLGWGEPFGSYIQNREMRQDNLEKWQFGIFKTNIKLALVLRGFLWGIFIAPAAYYFDERLWVLVPAYTIAFPISLFIAHAITPKKSWPLAETVRGWMAGTIIAGCLYPEVFVEAFEKIKAMF